MDPDNSETTDDQGELEADSQNIKEGNKDDADENSQEVLPEQFGDAEVETYQSGGEQDDEDEEAAPECASENLEKQQDNEELQAFVDELLKEKIKFNTGEEEFIYSRGPKYSDDMWPLNCHVCRKGNFVTLMQIKNHVKGVSHRGRLPKVLQKPQAHEQYMRPYRQNPSKNRGMLTPIAISPGEVIWELTEEHEGRIIREEDFQIQLAPEDVIKMADVEPMHEYNKKLPLIGLCYLYKMQVKSGNIHYYCLLCNMNLPKGGFKHITSPSHQYKYIGKHFPKLYAKVAQRLKKEPSCDFTISAINIFRKLYRKIENAKGFKEIVFVDHSHFYKYKNKYLNKVHKFIDHYDENTILITEHEVDILIRKSISKMEFIKPDHKMPGKPQREDKGRHMKRVLQQLYDNEEAAWQRYHFIMKRELEDLNQEYQNFDRNPNSHPEYFNEERSFFSRAGNDAQNLRNLKREWMLFWSRRLRQFYDSDLTTRKFKVKAELRLRTDMRTPSPTGSPSKRLRIQPKNRPSSSAYDGGYTEGPNRRTNVIDTQAPSEPFGIISVLRLLTALEDQLGILGPKAVELLSKALLADKSNQNSNDLMMDTDVYVFFVTAKEKLKGQIYANIVDENKIPAVNRAISDATNLLDMFDDYARRTGKHPTLPSPATTINQFESTKTTAQPSPNQFVSSGQSDSYKTNNSQYTSDNNQGGLNYSGPSRNPYQPGLGNGNTYSPSRGNGGNNYSTPTIVSSQYQTSGIGNQYSSGQQYDTNSNKDGSLGTGSGNLQGIGYSPRGAPNSFGIGSRNFQGYSVCNTQNSFGAGSGNSQGTGFSNRNTQNSFGFGSRNSQGTGFSNRNTQNSFGSGSGNSQGTGFFNRNTLNSFGTGSGNSQGTGYSSRNTPNTFGTGSRNFNNY